MVRDAATGLLDAAIPWNQKSVARHQSRVRREPTYRETWRHAHDALILVRVACERWNEVGIQCSGPIRSELVNFSTEIDTLTAVFEGVSEPTRNFPRNSYTD